jgi:cation transporter-like permease
MQNSEPRVALMLDVHFESAGITLEQIEPMLTRSAGHCCLYPALYAATGAQGIHVAFDLEILEALGASLAR